MSKLKITVTESADKLKVKQVTLREPLVEDFLEAQKYEGEVAMSAALISQICTFDGKQLTMEEVGKLPLPTFLELTAELNTRGLMGSAVPLSPSSEKVDSTTGA